jgi:hypothetical protein
MEDGRTVTLLGDIIERSRSAFDASFRRPRAHFVCMDWRHAKEMIAVGEDVYSELENQCVWNKPNAGMGSLYRSKHARLAFGVLTNRSRPAPLPLGLFQGLGSETPPLRPPSHMC